MDALKRVGCSLHLCATLEEEGDDITAYYRFKMIQVKILCLSPSVYVTHRLLPFRKATRLSWVQLHPCNCFHSAEASALWWIVASNVSAFRTNLFLFFLNFYFLTHKSLPPLYLPPPRLCGTEVPGTPYSFQVRLLTSQGFSATSTPATTMREPPKKDER